MTAIVRFFRYSLYVLSIAVTLFAGGFLLFVNAIDRVASTPQAAEGVVALTGGKDRIGQAFKLLAAGQAKRLLISGVNPSTKASQLQRLIPRGNEFFPCCVDLGRTALDTRGNAEETRAWVEKHGFSSLIVVTSAYHMPRTLIEFSGAMANIHLIPHAVVSRHFRTGRWWSPGPVQRLLFFEYLKYLNALARYAYSRLTGPSKPDDIVRS